MEKRTNLMNCTKKHLLEIAKDLQIVGRHNMRKEILVDAIIEKEKQGTLFKEKTPFLAQDNPKKEYERNAKIGVLVAFYAGNRMYSGKIIEIHEERFRIETKRGVRYLINKSDVAWYKTGRRWPRGVYEELIKRRTTIGEKIQ